jgi:hypothetical protein
MCNLWESGRPPQRARPQGARAGRHVRQESEAGKRAGSAGSRGHAGIGEMKGVASGTACVVHLPWRATPAKRHKDGVPGTRQTETVSATSRRQQPVNLNALRTSKCAISANLCAAPERVRRARRQAWHLVAEPVHLRVRPRITNVTGGYSTTRCPTQSLRNSLVDQLFNKRV